MMRSIAIVAGRARVATADPDLQLHRAPPGLTMRAHRVAAAGPSPAEPPPAAQVAPVPASTREVDEKVTVKIRAGVELDGAPASGDPLRGGAQLPAGFTGYRPWIVGDAMVGARDLVLPSLGGYLLSAFQLDASNAAATRSALVVPGDATDQRIAIKAGYAEWGRDETSDDQHLWLRAGRQYRLDAGGLFAYFDGATVGWREHAWNASVFGGQRVGLYVDTPPGGTFGGTASVDLGLLDIAPVKLSADAMGLVVAGETRQLIAVAGSY